MPLFLLLLIAACTTSHSLKQQKEAAKLQGKKSEVSASSLSTEDQAIVKQIDEDGEEEKIAEVAEVPDAPDVPAVTESNIKNLSLAEIAKKLNISEVSLRTQVWQMDLYLRKAPGWRSVCTQKYAINKNVCNYLRQLDIGYSNALDSTPAFRSRVKIRMKPSQFAFLQKIHYQQLISSIENNSPEEVYSWIPQLLSSRSCPQNLSAAALRKLESLLPSEEVRKGMEKLYMHVEKCLNPQDYAYEIVHLRHGLLRMSWGMEKLARESFVKAAEAKKNFDRRRVLFWAGLLSAGSPDREVYWKELTEQYPLTFHALEVWRYRNEDPYKLFSQKPYLKPTRYLAAKNIKSIQAQSGIYWLEAMYLLGKRQAAMNFSGKFTKVYADYLKAANIMYLAQLKEANTSPESSMNFINKHLANNPESINRQTLQMLFPKPYFHIFQKATEVSSTDPYLLLSVARQESSFNPFARSPANARGLMQILPSTARLLSGRRGTNLYSPENSVLLGAQYMAQLISRFGSVEKALAAYNAGPNRVESWEKRYPVSNMMLFLDLIPFKETRNYVTKILCNNYWYEKLYGEKHLETSLNKSKSLKMQKPIAYKKGRSRLVSRLLSIPEAVAKEPGMLTE